MELTVIKTQGVFPVFSFAPDLSVLLWGCLMEPEGTGKNHGA